MEATVTASDFRQKFPEIVKQVSDGKKIKNQFKFLGALESSPIRALSGQAWQKILLAVL